MMKLSLSLHCRIQTQATQRTQAQNLFILRKRKILIKNLIPQRLTIKKKITNQP